MKVKVNFLVEDCEGNYGILSIDGDLEMKPCLSTVNGYLPFTTFKALSIDCMPAIRMENQNG